MKEFLVFFFFLIILQDGLSYVKLMTFLYRMPHLTECLGVLLLLAGLFLASLPCKRLYLVQGRRVTPQHPSICCSSRKWLTWLIETYLSWRSFWSMLDTTCKPQQESNFSLQKPMTFSNVSALQSSTLVSAVLPGLQSNRIIPQPLRCVKTSAPQRARADTKGEHQGLLAEDSLTAVLLMCYFNKLLGFHPSPTRSGGTWPHTALCSNPVPMLVLSVQPLWAWGGSAGCWGTGTGLLASPQLRPVCLITNSFDLINF